MTRQQHAISVGGAEAMWQVQMCVLLQSGVSGSRLHIRHIARWQCKQAAEEP